MASIETEGGSRNGEQFIHEEGDDGMEFNSNNVEIDDNCEEILNLEGQSNVDGVSQNGDGEFGVQDYPVPVVGMEFESYDDAYNYYNVYAKGLGFAIRVKSSWTRRNTKEKRGAVLCCNCEGFKTVKEAHSRRKETRTGCLAMVRLRLVESGRWRVDEVKLEHNHLFDPVRAQSSKSHKKMDVGARRKAEPTFDVEVQTIKLYRTNVDQLGYGSSNSIDGEFSSNCSKRMKLKRGDAQTIQNYFSRAQLTNPNFFYSMDLNDEGFLRNVFWIDSKSRAAYVYFGDVVLFDTSYLSNKYEVPLFAFIGINHHMQPILFGCGLLADDAFETYIWLFRAWLTCMSGRPPQTIISDHCKTLQSAIAEVFPRAQHCLHLARVEEFFLDNLGTRLDYGELQMNLNAAIYDCLRVDEFERAWEDMVRKFGISDHEWLRSLYDDRERWAPVYSKDTSLAGIATFEKGELLSLIFYGYVHRQTSLEEFFDIYELVLEKKNQSEAFYALETRKCRPSLRTGSYYELQLSKVYTDTVFRKFQDEIARIPSCFSVIQVHTTGPMASYLIKEHTGEENFKEVRNFEVMYDKSGPEVRCVCGCFNFKGYLCRHALCVLHYNGLEEVPYQYILSRWRKDIRRMHILDQGFSKVDTANPVQRFDQLYRQAMQVVEEGMASQDHYTVAWQSFKESLDKVRFAGNKNVG